MRTRAIVGQGRFIYEVDKQWGRRADGVPAFGVVSGVACDSSDRVYVFNRAPNPCVMVFGANGNLLRIWGDGQFKHPHGIWISPEDEVYLTDRDTHLVTKWTLDGHLLRRWGTPDQPGAPGEPFNQPTHAFAMDDGEMYVSDGYGQQRVHHFGRDGELINSWGSKGAGPGQFALPHDVWVDSRGRVLICDRENRRIQHFDRSGRYLEEWADIDYPNQICIWDDVVYVAEARQRVSIRDLDGRLLASWGSKGEGPEQFTDSPHSIWVDSRGDVYVGEVVRENKLQKYVLV